MDDRLRQRVEALLRAELELGTRTLDDTTELAGDLLLDSLATVELVMVLEDELDIGLADTAVADLVTVGDLHMALHARLHARQARILSGA